MDNYYDSLIDLALMLKDKKWFNELVELKKANKNNNIANSNKVNTSEIYVKISEIDILINLMVDMLKAKQYIEVKTIANNYLHQMKNTKDKLSLLCLLIYANNNDHVDDLLNIIK